MGARGPAPTPTAILNKRDSWRATRNRREPKPKPGRPVCPRWISKQAKRAWKELIPQLDAMGVLTRVDRNALIRYTQTWASWRRCVEFINKHGESYPMKDKAGQPVGFKAFPQVKIANELAVQLGKLEQQFGLTPSARTRLEVIDSGPREEANGDDDKVKFINFA